MIPAKSVERFWSKVNKAAPKECWEWNACLERGYGTFHLNGKNHKAHRVSLLIHRQTIPDGMVVDHVCRNRACVNPSHLRVVTKTQNTLENNDNYAAVNARKTECVKGHPFNKENTRVRYWNKRPFRECIECQRAHIRASREREYLARGYPAKWRWGQQP